MIRSLSTLAGCAAAALAFAPATANPLPVYPNPGVVNPLDYTFTATADGDIIAYFAGATAGFTNILGLIVNGVDTGINGLNNQTSQVGDSLNFGPVSAGDSLIFYIDVLSTGNRFFSSRPLNPDGITHIFAAPYIGGLVGPGGTVPAGTYVGFEDIFGGGDLDYDDLNFVFVNTRFVTDIPEPATWAMLIAGFGLVGFALRRKVAVTA
jgi:hypothetical protein